MKKIFNYAWLLSLLVILSITFVSCNKDDEENSISKKIDIFAAA